MKLRNKLIILFIFFLFIILFSIYIFFNNNIIFPYDYNNKNSNNITVVSGYWKVKNKYSDTKYDEWFNNTLKINQRYIFFCEKETIEYIEKFRKDYETIYKIYNLNNFYSKKYLRDDWIHSLYVPSIEIGMIWNEKIHLMKIAKDEDPNPTDFYVWIDAGVTPYREKKPPDVRLNLKDVNSLPKDKISYSHESTDYHNFAATVLIIPRDIIDEVHDKFYQLLGNCNEDWKCSSDQYIFTKMLKLHPELFNKISEGYGENLSVLYEKYV
jgi:hypothetical protein